MSLFMSGNIFTQNRWVGGGFYSQFLGRRTAMKNIEGCLSSYPLYLEKNMLLKLGRSRRVFIES